MTRYAAIYMSVRFTASMFAAFASLEDGPLRLYVIIYVISMVLSCPFVVRGIRTADMCAAMIATELTLLYVVLTQFATVPAAWFLCLVASLFVELVEAVSHIAAAADIYFLPIYMEFYRKGDKIFDSEQKQVTDPTVLEYIRKLVIPPAYRDVTIFYPKGSKRPNILFEGFDAKGRLQQIYSPEWRAKADRLKFKKLIEFGYALPLIFATMDEHVAESKASLNKCIATILKVVSVCYFRIGHEKYERLYESHGISTIKKKHIRLLADGNMQIQFIGKKGVENHCIITDKGLIKLLQAFIAGKKQEDYVFTYGAGRERVRATEINDYLKRFNGDFTSKMFRTFDSNTLLIDYLRKKGRATLIAQKDRKAHVRSGLVQVSQCVNNTPAICKKSYVYPKLIELYIERPKEFDALIASAADPREVFINLLLTQYKDAAAQKK